MLRKFPVLRSSYHTWLGLLNYFNSWRSPFLRRAPAGHYLSALPSPGEIQARAGSLFDRTIEVLPGIDLCQDKQIGLLEDFSSLEEDFLYSKDTNARLRYTPNNTYFPFGDALVLYSFLRHYLPKHIIEIGSGYSSAVILDTNDHFLPGNTRFTFIEPNPERLYHLLRPLDRQRTTILEQPVQEISLDIFQELKANDILFIDSSHILKIGSDLAYLIFEVLPALNEGVIIHFHDIFWPFEYPQAWYEQGYCCNEDYVLRSFLQFNEKFSIIFFTSYLQIHQSEAINKYLPTLSGNSGCSLWLVKNK